MSLRDEEAIYSQQTVRYTPSNLLDATAGRLWQQPEVLAGFLGPLQFDK
jgi:hypothetical protein